MFTRPRTPVQGTISAIAAAVSLVLFAAAPALATSDRDIVCDESAAPTLKVAESEFTTPQSTDKNDAEASDVIEAENADSAEQEADAELAVPAKGSQLIYKRQMYRRDI